MGKELLSPKVVVIEKDPELRAVRGVATATTGIVGIFERGPIATPTLVKSIAEFRRVYGGFITAGSGPEAVDGFFRNGGKFIHVSRTVHFTDITSFASKTSVLATVTLKDEAGSPLDTLQVDAKYDGAWGNGLTLNIKAPTNGAADEFNMEILVGGVLTETFPNLSITDADTNFVETVINAIDGTGSNLIVVTDLDSATASPQDRPSVQSGTALTTGDDGLTSIADADFTGDNAAGNGFHAFKEINDIRILLCVDQQTTAVHQGMQDYAEVDRDGSMVALFEPPVSQTAAQANTYILITAALYNRSEYSFMMWPWVKVPNPSEAVYGKTADGTITVPPSGHIAGLFARVDGSEPGGVYKAAAGTERGIIRGITGVETEEVFDVNTRDLIYPNRINPITKLPGTSLFLHGSVTTKDNGRFPFINQRRGVIFIELSVQGGLIFAMHAQNNNRLRAVVDRTVFVFLLEQFRHGAFAGATPEESFTLDVDIPGEGLNSAAEQFAGRLNVDIGLAMVTPTQFVVIRISPDQRAILEAAA